MTGMDLFDEMRSAHRGKARPLAARMRPRTLDEFVGQEHFLGPGKLLRRMLLADRLSSLVFYGPPGSGKTALAHVIASQTNAPQSGSAPHAAVTIRAASAADGGRGSGCGNAGLSAWSAGLTSIHRHRTARFNAPDRIQWICRIDAGANGLHTCGRHVSVQSCGPAFRCSTYRRPPQ